MEFKAVIFDLDGTLLDTLNDLADAGNRVLSDAGFSIHPVDSYRYFVCDGLATLILRILPEDMMSDEQVHQIASLADRIPAGGDSGLAIVITILIIVALVLLIVYLYKRV